METIRRTESHHLVRGVTTRASTLTCQTRSWTRGRTSSSMRSWEMEPKRTMNPDDARSDDPGPLLDPHGGPNDYPGDIWPADEMIEEAEFWDAMDERT